MGLGSASGAISEQMFFNLLLVPGQVAHQPSRRIAVKLANLLGASRRRRRVQLATSGPHSSSPYYWFHPRRRTQRHYFNTCIRSGHRRRANVIPERECKMLPGTLCRARPAATLADWSARWSVRSLAPARQSLCLLAFWREYLRFRDCPHTARIGADCKVEREQPFPGSAQPARRATHRLK